MYRRDLSDVLNNFFCFFLSFLPPVLGRDIRTLWKKRERKRRLPDRSSFLSTWEWAKQRKGRQMHHERMWKKRGEKKRGPNDSASFVQLFFFCCRCSFVGSKKSKSYEWPRLASDHVPIQVQNGDGGGLSKASLAKNLIWLCSQPDKSPKARPSVHCTTTLERREAGGKRTDEVIQVVIPFQPFPFFFFLAWPPRHPPHPPQNKQKNIIIVSGQKSANKRLFIVFFFINISVKRLSLSSFA